MLKLSRVIICVMCLFAVAIACEGPSGLDGAQGPEGPQGPIGPAGEDGSMMYAGAGEPSEDVGDIGDYYLNQDTGELHGPKDSDGWGNPIIILMGEDGQDGANGQDGEDGSQIYSGNGAPDASLGVVGDYYLDKDSYELYGPKNSNGWGTQLNLKGADGNANVTRYIFPGHDFNQDNRFYQSISVSRTEMQQSAWLTYLVVETNTSNSVLYYYALPGYGHGGTSSYSAYHYHSDTYNNISYFNVRKNDGTGEAYDQIEVVRIEANNTEDMAKQKSSITPDHLDTSDYDAVAEYYGFYQ